VVRRGDDGFTLLETLVAVAVLAILVGSVPRSFVFARSVIDHSRDWMDARLVAEAVLNDELTGVGLQPGIRSGVVNGRSWRATLLRYAAGGTSSVDGGAALLEVRLEVDVSPGRHLNVDTVRIGRAE
jgi:general secretion pathway protein I